LDKRYEEYKSGKLGLHDWKEVHSVIRERNQKWLFHLIAAA